MEALRPTEPAGLRFRGHGLADHKAAHLALAKFKQPLVDAGVTTGHVFMDLDFRLATDGQAKSPGSCAECR